MLIKAKQCLFIFFPDNGEVFIFVFMANGRDAKSDKEFT